MLKILSILVILILSVQLVISLDNNKVSYSYPEVSNYGNNQQIFKDADSALKRDPNPIKKIVSSGKLESDSNKKKSKESLKDMKRIYALTSAYKLSGDEIYLVKSKEYILAWAKKNKPTGNPIDEDKLKLLFFSYNEIKDRFSVSERNIADRWLNKIVIKEMDYKLGPYSSKNNINSHRIANIGIIGFILDEQKYIDYAIENYKNHIEKNLYPDGSSYDYHQRDSLFYHTYNLEPLLTLAIIADKHGKDIYDYTSTQGASLNKSVIFLVPYLNGELAHQEFVNSTEDFDKARADAGEDKFKAGRFFDPQEALRVLELNSYFDENINHLIQSIRN